jgi:hypothetical protein
VPSKIYLLCRVLVNLIGKRYFGNKRTLSEDAILFEMSRTKRIPAFIGSTGMLTKASISFFAWASYLLNWA